MRISLLLKREPFGEILEQTLAGFLRSRTGVSHGVRWRAGRSHAGRGQNWLCNPYLNVLFVPHACREIFQPAIREFSRSTRPWRTPLQQLYVFFATHPLTARFLAIGGLEVSPELEGAERCAFLGGNHHIRLLDYGKRCCFVVGKAGFDTKFMEAEIRVRRAYPYLPAPKILDVGADLSWYREELILGTPVNRLKESGQTEAAVRFVAASLLRLYDASAENVESAAYAADMVLQIKQTAVSTRQLSQKMRQDIFQDLTVLQGLVAAHPDARTLIVQSHGDFQPANVLLGANRSWLIDWEYTARRQSSYDALVYSLSSRSPAGLGGRIESMGDSESTLLSRLLSVWPLTELRDKTTREATLALFLLEELALKLTEVSNPLFKTLETDFSVFLEEIQRSVAVLERSRL